MKKTLTVNLGGTVYHIDDDAYRLLDNYLSNLKHYFRKQEGAEEIINDIEMRIAELFAEKVAAGKQVITVQDVEEVIARVGKPEDFGITEDDAESNKRTEQSSSASQTYTRTAGSRRLFRDPDSKLLGVNVFPDNHIITQMIHCYSDFCHIGTPVFSCILYLL